MAIKQLTKDEKAERSTEVLDGIATCVRTVKPDNDSPIRCVVSWRFNFANVTQDELIELATSRLVIDTQRRWRALPDAERMSDAWARRTFHVRSLLDAERATRTSDPVAKATKLLESMSEEQKAQLRALLG